MLLYKEMGHSASKTTRQTNDPVVLREGSEQSRCRGAVVLERTDTVSSVVLTDVVVPDLQPSEVLIRVHAASLNRADVDKLSATGGLWQAGGMYNRDAPHSAPPIAYPYCVGTDGAGVIAAVGSSVSELHVGQRVCFYLDSSKPFGALCEYTVADSNGVVELNEGVSFFDGATLPSSAWVAYLALFDKLRVQRGSSVLVHGASGGVGSVAVQLAKHVGCFVVASCSKHNCAFVKSLGADVALDYLHDNIGERLLQATQGVGVDYVLDCTAEPDATFALLFATRFSGAVCFLSNRPRCQIPEYVYSRQLSLHHVFLAGFCRSKGTSAMLKQLGQHVNSLMRNGSFVPQYEKVSLVQLQTALLQVSTGHTRGKLVLDLDDR